MKKYWQTKATTIPGVLAIIGGIYDLLETKSLNQNNMLAFATGWGLIQSQSILKK